MPSTTATKIPTEEDSLEAITEEAPGTTTKLAKAQTEDEVLAVTGDPILPDPAHFQVLGIPRPAGSSPLLRPKVSILQTGTDGDGPDNPGAFGGVVSAGGSAKTVSKLTSLPPAPLARHEITLPPIEPDDGDTPYPDPTTPSTTENTPEPEGDKSETEKSEDDKAESQKNRKESGSKKPVSKEAGSKKSQEQSGDSEGFGAPVLDFGNVSAISNGVVINAHSAIESAVAPPKPLFTVLPPPPKVEFGPDEEKESFIEPFEFTTVSSTVRTTTGTCPDFDMGG